MRKALLVLGTILACAVAGGLLLTTGGEVARTCDALDPSEVLTPSEVIGPVADTAAAAGRQPQRGAPRQGPEHPGQPDPRDAPHPDGDEHPFASGEPMTAQQRLHEYFLLVAPDRYGGIHTVGGTEVLLTDHSHEDLRAACSLATDTERLRLAGAGHSLVESEALEDAAHEWLAEQRDGLDLSHWSSVIGLTSDSDLSIGTVSFRVLAHDDSDADPPALRRALEEELDVEVASPDEPDGAPITMELLREEDLPRAELY